MKLDKLRILQDKIKEELGRNSVTSTIYYFYNNRWIELDSENNCDSIINSLKRAKSEKIAYHATSDLDAWFYFSSSDFVVKLRFLNSPQKATRTQYRDKLENLIENATNAYKVSHNQLTHLLAKDAFRESLYNSIKSLDSQNSFTDETQINMVSRSLFVMALDIDYFKQINDTWGHLYGDQVLKTFGLRLEKCAEIIRHENIGNPEIYLGHPSGEEFLIFITANASRDQFLEWANEFRKKISEEILPTEKEWEWLTSSGDISVISPPPLQDRGVTVSVGVAIHNDTSSIDSGLDLVSSLLDRADTALYKAKSAGRNQVILYNEILSSCGQIIEQNKLNQVIAIDIGSNVGVSVGQEFKVFSPTFSGKTKFLVNDGRTTRTLGTYPKVEAARIVVFNAQPEISFAFIASDTSSDIFLEVGSHLEAIPAGSIGHLLPSSSKYFPSAPNTREKNAAVDPQEFVKKAAADGKFPFAIVIRFSRESEYLRKYGTVSLNLALAQLYREAQVKFHTSAVIEVLDKGTICIVGDKNAYSEQLISEFIESLASELPELGVFAGIFCEADHKSSIKEEQNALDCSNSIEFARFAASDAGRAPDLKLRHFGYNEATKVLQALRDSRSFNTAYADFEMLRNLGVESARLLNLGGLIAGSLGLPKQALDHYLAAITKDPDTLIYKSNYGTVAYQINEIEPALKILNAIPLSDLDGLIKTHPYGYVTYARLLAKARTNHSDLFDVERFTHIANNALIIPGFEKPDEANLIRIALNQSKNLEEKPT